MAMRRFPHTDGCRMQFSRDISLKEGKVRFKYRRIKLVINITQDIMPKTTVVRVIRIDLCVALQVYPNAVQEGGPEGRGCYVCNGYSKRKTKNGKSSLEYKNVNTSGKGKHKQKYVINTRGEQEGQNQSIERLKESLVKGRTKGPDKFWTKGPHLRPFRIYWSIVLQTEWMAERVSVQWS